MLFVRFVLLMLLLAASPGVAGASAEKPAPVERVKEAVTRSLKLLEFSGSLTMDQRACFSCHHGSNPATAAAVGWTRGFDPGEEEFKSQLLRTHDQLSRDVARLRQARFAGGQADAPGHALWFLDEAGWPRDSVTAAAVEFFLGHEADSDHWSPELHRPPTVGSHFTTTFVVLRALQRYGPGDGSAVMARRTEKARAWALQTASEDTEDSVYRLRILHLMQADQEAVRTEGAKLLGGQREDGGWAQRPLMKSDAYATATALAALLDTEQISPSDRVFQRGAAYLLTTQDEDGSWQVSSRAKQVQPFFQSGFPYGANQFISIAATSWATYALLRSLPVSETRIGKRYLDDRVGLVAEVRRKSAPMKFTADQIAFFTDRIAPVLRDRCYSCHSAEAKKIKAGLYVDDPAKLLAGGDSGPPLVPGDPEHSLLLKSLRGLEDMDLMPPKKRLTEREIADFQRWIAMGAPVPGSAP